MARPFPLPCDTDMKWVFKAGFNIDPATLAKNLTILCTVAFSATVLYVMYSNSKRPQYTHNNIQVSFSDDEELSDEDHTTQCETRCRHSIVGNSDRSRPPDRLMSFGIPLEDVQSSSPSRAYCRTDSAVDVNMAKDGLGDESLTTSEILNVQTQPSTASCMASDHIHATNDVDTSAGRQDDCLNTCESDTAETQNLPSIMASDLNSSCDVSMAAESFVDGNLSSIESLFTQVQPSTISTASGPDVIETSCTQIQQSTTSNASGPKVIESSCTQTPPSTTSTASGPDVTAAGRLDDTSLCSGFTKENAHFHCDPECMRAQVGLLRHFREGESLIRSREELDVINEDGAENLHSMEKDDDGGSHFEGYIYGIIREKASKSYKRRLYGGVSFAKEKRDQGDGGCSREKTDLGGKVGIRCQEACTKIEGGEACEGISAGRPHKLVEGIRNKNFDIVSSQEGCVKTLSRDYRPRHRESCTQTEVKDKGISISVDSFSAREACTGRPLKQIHTITKEETRHLLGKKFENRDKGIGKFVDTFSASSTREACTGRPLRQRPKGETHHLLGNNFEKCKDKGTSTSVDTFPTSRTRGAWTGRPFKETRTMPMEEVCHSVDHNSGVVERCAEERREGGITSVQSEPVDPLEQTISSLKALTETQHWSKMSRPEQYEYLELLDSTLAAASSEWKGKRNVTYWRNKDSAPPLKLSGLSSLRKPQGESEYSSRFTPGRIEVPAPKTSSPGCPTVDRAHLHFQGDANCTNMPSSSSRQVEQFCAEVTCVEAQQIMQDKQSHRPLSSHPQGNHQPSSLSTSCESLPYRLPRSMQNSLLDESNRRAYISAETRRLQSEAARENLTRTKLLAKNSKYHYM